MDREHRARIIFRAERTERTTKPWGRPSGIIGASGLTILRVLMFRFARDAEPSYRAIRTATGLAFSTISAALQRLEAAGFIIIERRRRKTVLGVRVINNRYSFPAMSQIPESGRPKLPRLLIPYEQLGGTLKAALERLGAAMEAIPSG